MGNGPGDWSRVYEGYKGVAADLHGQFQVVDVDVKFEVVAVEDVFVRVQQVIGLPPDFLEDAAKSGHQRLKPLYVRLLQTHQTPTLEFRVYGVELRVLKIIFWV